MRIWLSAAALATGASLLAGAAVAGRGAAGLEIRVAVSNATTLDPVFAYPDLKALHYATCLKLMNHRDAPARRSAELVPEATTFPRISRDGRNYDFVLRADLSRFSNGEGVDAMTFKRTIDRMARLISRDQQHLLADIVGGLDVLQGRATSVSGVRASGRRLRITLVAPAGDLLRRLATPQFCAVPRGVPDRFPQTPVPSAGPYYVRDGVQGNFATLERNPHYRGLRPRRPDRIHFSWLSTSAAVEEVRAGRFDLYRFHHAYTQAPPGRTLAIGNLLLLQFDTRVGKALGQQPLRKAIALALDRRAIARTRTDALEVPFDRFIPPTVPGASRTRVYPLQRRAADLERARTLAAPFLPLTLRLLADGAEPAAYIDQVYAIERNIEETGIKVDVRFCPRCHHVDFDGDIRLRWVGLGGFSATGDPVEYLRGAISGPSPIVDRANRLRGRARLAAFRRLETQLVRDLVPAAAFSIANEKHLVSTRLGCLEPHHVYAVNLGRLCLRP